MPQTVVIVGPFVLDPLPQDQATNCCYRLLKSQKRWNPMPSILSLSFFSFFSATKSSSLQEKTKENCIWLMRMMQSKICPPLVLLIPFLPWFLFLSCSSFFFSSFLIIFIPWNRPHAHCTGTSELLVVIYLFRYLSEVLSQISSINLSQQVWNCDKINLHQKRIFA